MSGGERQLAQVALDLLDESENSLLTQAGIVGGPLQELQRVDAGAAPLLELHEQGVATLRELQSELSRYADKMDIDPARLTKWTPMWERVAELTRMLGGQSEAARKHAEALLNGA